MSNNAFKVTLVFAAASMLLFCSCTKTPQGPLTTYGRSSGVEYVTSLNGTKAYKTMLSNKGYDVDRYRRFSPRLNKYSTVIWFPDKHYAPREEAVEFVESWLADGRNRTVVYVGRDFDAEPIYWNQMAGQATTSAEKITCHRRSARAAARVENEKNTFYWDTPKTECDWFTIVENPRRKVTELSGQYADKLESAKADMYMGYMLEPANKTGYDVEVLLKANGKPFIYSLSRPSWAESQILVINNGSFLLNLPLANHEHRELANILADKFVADPVVFVEHQNNVEISSSEFDNPNRWSWVAKKPLRYIVPHLLFWTVLFCFVYFPIFGRPKRTAKKSTTNFRDHIRAMGKLLERTDSRGTAERWIEECRDRTSNKRSKN